MNSAAAKVLALPELVEHILVCLARSTLHADHDIVESKPDGETATNTGAQSEDEGNFSAGNEVFTDRGYEPPEYIRYDPNHQRKSDSDYGEYPQPLKCLSAVRRVNYLFHHTISTSKKIQRLLSTPRAHQMRTYNPPAVIWLLGKQLGFDLELSVTGSAFTIKILGELGLRGAIDPERLNALDKLSYEYGKQTWKQFVLCGYGNTELCVGKHGRGVYLRMEGKMTLGRLFNIVSDIAKGRGTVYRRLKVRGWGHLNEADKTMY